MSTDNVNMDGDAPSYTEQKLSSCAIFDVVGVTIRGFGLWSLVCVEYRMLVGRDVPKTCGIKNTKKKKIEIRRRAYIKNFN